MLLKINPSFAWHSVGTFISLFLIGTTKANNATLPIELFYCNTDNADGWHYYTFRLTKTAQGYDTAEMRSILFGVPYTGSVGALENFQGDIVSENTSFNRISHLNSREWLLDPAQTARWYPKVVGDTLIWAGETEIEIPSGDLYWKFLSSDLPNSNTLITAIENCDTLAPSSAPSNEPTAPPSHSRVTDLNGNVVFYPASFTLNSELIEALDYFCENDGAIEVIEAIYGPVAEWDTSQVTSFASIMNADKNSNRATCNPDVSGWNTSSVRNMRSAFKKASSFDQDLGAWDMTNVDSARAMFRAAGSFQGRGLEKWDVSNVADMNWMFYQAHAFDANVTDWNTGNVVSFKRAFSKATSFQGVGLETWDVHKAATMARMFQSNFDSPAMLSMDLSSWDVSRVANFESMFSSTSFSGDLCNWSTKMDSGAIVTDIFGSTLCSNTNDPMYSAASGHYLNVCAECM